MKTLLGRLTSDRITTRLVADDYMDAVDRTARLLRNAPEIGNWQEFHEGIMNSIGQDGSNLGHGFALAHARTTSVRDIVIALATIENGKIQHPDGEPAEILAVVGVPDTLANEYMQILGCLVRVLSRQSARAEIAQATRSDQVLAALRKAII